MGTGDRLDLVKWKFVASDPDRLHVTDIPTRVWQTEASRMLRFVTDVHTRHIVGWVHATTMSTKELTLWTLEQAISWTIPIMARSISAPRAPSRSWNMRCCRRTAQSTTSDNAMVENINGVYKAELV